MSRLTSAIEEIELAPRSIAPWRNLIREHARELTDRRHQVPGLKKCYHRILFGTDFVSANTLDYLFYTHKTLDADGDWVVDVEGVLDQFEQWFMKRFPNNAMIITGRLVCRGGSKKTLSS